jgi:uncharacterized hydrophobic protein (TIGR00271 family)
LTSEQRRAVLDMVALRPDRAWLYRFALLQGLSVVIAVMGLTTNSAAVVIGAMLVAPLMGPIMGLSASLAMGWGIRALRTSALVFVPATGSIALAYLLSAFVPGNGVTGEVLARTSPGSTDLVIALAAGLAGAYATVRPDISSSLPGVAVAVALVPPLSTVGITLQAGQVGLATGALLLFVTNLAAIVFAGLVVFPLTGFVPARRLSQVRGRLAAYAIAVGVVVALLTTTLTGRTLKAIRQADDAASARQLVASWLTGTGLELTDFEFSDGDVAVTVSGPNAPPQPTALALQLTDLLGEPAELEVKWQQRSTIAANGSGLREVDLDIVRDEVGQWLAGTGVDLDQFVFDTALDDGGVRVAVSGPVAPPDQRSLERRLSLRLGVALPVAIEATVVVPDAEEQERLRSTTNIATAWASERGLDVSFVVVDRDATTVVIEGPEAPRESNTLRELLAAGSVGPSNLVVRYRSAVEIPTQREPAFRWPVDCADDTSNPPVPVAPLTGFTASPLGTWLAARLPAGGIAFSGDDSTFSHDYADGTLHIWASPGGPTDDPRTEVAPPMVGSGPRGSELRGVPAGDVTIWSAVVPHDLDRPPTTSCLPATTALDTWFAAVTAAADASPYTEPLTGYRPTSPETVTPALHIVAVAARAGLPVTITAHDQLVLQGEGTDADLVALRRPAAPNPHGETRRAGGLTLWTPATDPTIVAMLDQLAVQLRDDPYLGQRAPTPDLPLP